MQFTKANQLPFDPKSQMGMIFAEGYYQWLGFFSKDKENLSKALEHMFDLDYFFVAEENNKIAAIAACTNRKSPPVRLDKKILSEKFGLVRGSIAYVVLKKNLVDHSYPFEVPQQTASIEFVATAPEYKGKGVAYSLITYIMQTLSHSEYILEVADNNIPAIRLYEKLGFNEFERILAPKGSGIKYLIYMKKES